jgi:hypothetical protein
MFLSPIEIWWLIKQEMASKSFGLFVNSLQTADEESQVQLIYIIYDLLILHDSNVIVSGTLPVCPPSNHENSLMK